MSSKDDAIFQSCSSLPPEPSISRGGVQMGPAKCTINSSTASRNLSSKPKEDVVKNKPNNAFPNFPDAPLGPSKAVTNHTDNRQVDTLTPAVTAISDLKRAPSCCTSASPRSPENVAAPSALPGEKHVAKKCSKGLNPSIASPSSPVAVGVDQKIPEKLHLDTSGTRTPHVNKKCTSLVSTSATTSSVNPQAHLPPTKPKEVVHKRSSRASSSARKTPNSAERSSLCEKHVANNNKDCASSAPSHPRTVSSYVATSTDLKKISHNSEECKPNHAASTAKKRNDKKICEAYTTSSALSSVSSSASTSSLRSLISPRPKDPVNKRKSPVPSSVPSTPPVTNNKDHADQARPLSEATSATDRKKMPEKSLHSRSSNSSKPNSSHHRNTSYTSTSTTESEETKSRHSARSSSHSSNSSRQTSTTKKTKSSKLSKGEANSGLENVSLSNNIGSSFLSFKFSSSAVKRALSLTDDDDDNEVTNMNNQKTLSFNHGDVYVGQCDAEGNLHGFGKYSWFKTENTYEGYWIDGKQNGFGIYKWKSRNDQYRGEWEAGIKSGIGVYITESGNWTIGTFRNNVMNGYAMVLRKDCTEIIFLESGVPTGEGARFQKSTTATDASIKSYQLTNGKPTKQKLEEESRQKFEKHGKKLLSDYKKLCKEYRRLKKQSQ